MRIPSLHRSTIPSPGDPDHVEHGCNFMRDMLTGLADGSLQGILRWYAECHVSGCPHCSAALEGLKELRARLRSLGLPESSIEEGMSRLDATEPSALNLLSPERRAAITVAWETLAQEEQEQRP